MSTSKTSIILPVAVPSWIYEGTNSGQFELATGIVFNRVVKEIDSNQSYINSNIERLFDTIISANDWLVGTSYSKYDVVKDPTSGSVYVSLADTNVGNALTDTIWWSKNLSEQIANKGVADGYASLNSLGVIPDSQIPPYAITNTFDPINEAAMLALTAQTGDIARRADISATYILQGADPSILSNWVPFLSATQSVNSVGGNTGVVTDLQLITSVINVDGAGSGLDSDLLDGLEGADYEVISRKGVANGYPSLDAGGLIPQAQLPPVTITDTFVVVDQTAMLALTAQTGDVAVRTDESKSYILRGGDPSLLPEWEWLQTPTDAVLSVGGNIGIVTNVQLLASILTVDGDGSLLDADLLDGLEGTYYLDWNNFSNLPTTVSGYGITDAPVIYNQEADPGSVNQGDFWLVSSTGIMSTRVGAGWDQLVTASQLADPSGTIIINGGSF